MKLPPCRSLVLLSSLSLSQSTGVDLRGGLRGSIPNDLLNAVQTVRERSATRSAKGMFFTIDRWSSWK